MVPHGRVEEAIGEIAGECPCVVTAIEDERRGERLAALYVCGEISPAELWQRLAETSLPRLWLPKRENLYQVEALPMLATGKLDLRAVRRTRAGIAPERRRKPRSQAMNYSEYLDRLMTLEKRVAELTGRVYRLEHVQSGTDDENQASVPTTDDETDRLVPLREERSRASVPTTDDENRASVPLREDENRASVPLTVPRFAEPWEPARRTSAEWEALLGGNLLNKLGAVVLVVGIALALGYSFTYMGPGGRDAIGLAAAAAMLGTGALYERRPRYRTFARGVLGAGWATLYFTVCAMLGRSTRRA